MKSYDIIIGYISNFSQWTWPCLWHRILYNLLHFSRKTSKTSKFFKCIQYQIIWRYVYKLEFKIETSFYFDHAWIVWIQSLLIIQTKGLLYCHVIKTKFVKTEKRLSWRSFATTKFTYTEHIKVQSMYSKTSS